MSEEETIESRKSEKNIKLKSKKSKKTEDSDVKMHEVEDFDGNKGIEHSQASDKDEAIESYKRKRKDRGKKKCKKADGVDVYLEKNDPSKDELIHLHGENNFEYSVTYDERRKEMKKEKSKKKNGASDSIRKVEDTNCNKGIKHSQASDNDETIERKKLKRKDREKKCKKAEGLDSVDLEKIDSSKSKLIGLYGEHNTEDSVTNIGRKKEAKKEKSKKKDGASDNGVLKIEDTGEEREIEHSDKDEIVERRQKRKKKDKKMNGVEDVDLEKSCEAGAELIDLHDKDSTGVPINNMVKKKKKKDKSKNKNGTDNIANGKDNIGDAMNNVENVEEEKNVKNTNGDGNKKNGKDSIQDGDAINTLVRRKKKKKKDETDNENEAGDNANGEDGIGDVVYNEGIAEEVEVNESAYEESVSGIKNKKKSKTEKRQNIIENQNDAPEKGEKKKKKRSEKQSGENKKTGSNKKVRFSSEVEVFNLSPKHSTTENNEEEDKDKIYRWNNKGDNLIRGKRFSKEEDEIIKAAVLKYIKLHNLGEDGLDMVLNPSKHRLRGCWKEIGNVIPYRPCKAVYMRAQVLLRKADYRMRWTQDDIKMIHNYQKSHGNKWKDLADVMGTFCVYVAQVWRRTRLPNLKRGKWSQQEYQKLFDLVHTNLQLKVAESREKNTRYGLLRDNIGWTSISDELETRSYDACCMKWYRHLTSPMVVQGVWADSDDYRMIGRLYSLDASSIEDVDWDELLENRSGELCRKRWNQMSLHIGRNGLKKFAEQVEVLTHRYCPHLFEIREEWDNKPRVP